MVEILNTPAVEASLCAAIVGNLVGDYLLQNDWQAMNKKSSTFVCSVHCAIWASCVVLFAGWGWMPLGVLFITHFIQDRTNIIPYYMRTVGQRGFAEGVCAPWSTIIADNVFHILTIYVIWRSLL